MAPLASIRGLVLGPKGQPVASLASVRARGTACGATGYLVMQLNRAVGNMLRTCPIRAIRVRDMVSSFVETAARNRIRTHEYSISGLTLPATRGELHSLKEHKLDGT